MSRFDNIGIIIPALNPNEGIIKLINGLKENELHNILVVDDGSKEENKKFFKELEKNGVKVLVHEVNQGKGQALKNALKEFSKDSKIDGVVTVDCDGQHLVKDVVKISEKLQDGEFVIGKRNLYHNRETPIFSKIGNAFSSFYLKISSGKFLEDTQNGLRGIPRKHFGLALEIEGDRYEYEMNFLKEICSKKQPIETVEIETVYKDRIKNFRVIKDSYLVYKNFFRNILSSLICAILVLFMVFKNVLTVFTANIIARVISGVIDFGINKLWVFNNKTDSKTRTEFLKYLVLFIAQMLINSGIITLLSLVFTELLIVKIILNTIMYIINYFIKSKFIFI